MGGGLAPRNGRFTPRDRGPGTPCTGGWVSVGVSLDACENLAPPEFEPRTIKPTDSRNTDHAIPAVS
jgi:hypothetical protein